MPKVKYYTKEQRSESKHIQMLDYQAQRRLGTITQLGGKCTVCGHSDSDSLVLAPEALLCANCNAKQRAVEARDRLTKRKEALQQCRIAAWQQELANKKDEPEPTPAPEESPTEHSIRIAAELQVLQARRAQEIQAQLDEQQEEEDKYTIKAKQKWIEENSYEQIQH